MGSASKILWALALTVALAAPASAGAAEVTGNTTLVVSSGKAKRLANVGVAFGGVQGAQTTGRETRLQISGGDIGANAAQLTHSGAVRFLAGSGRSRRAVRLTAVQVYLGPGGSFLSAVLKGKRRVVFDLKGSAPAIQPAEGTAQLHGAHVVWRRSVAKTIGRQLGIRIPRGALGEARASAAIVFSETPKQGVLSNEPPLLSRPASAIDVGSGALTWHVRDSWIRYANTEVAPEVFEGASAGAPVQENNHPCPISPAGTNPTLVYSYAFPFANGWYDPASGTAALYESGGIRFSYPGHGIDLAMRNPEIEINGAASRAIFRLRSSAYQDVRAPVMDLAVTGPPVESPPGTFTYSAPVRGALTADGQSVFAGFYAPPNNAFGCFSISFATN